MEMTITFGAGKRVNAQVNGFEIRTDQPAAAGGDGSAPEPFTLFLASIGTCAGIYVLGFCQARGIPTEGISLVQHVEWDREQHRLARVGVEIRLPASFPEKYRDAVRRAAETCAVKKAIFDPPELTVTTTTAG
ncbi:MAG TPA: OsmC family protein [Polyangia bacterium]|jgi:ribosomal protein S12 methylthiotransferase accessory factor